MISTSISGIKVGRMIGEKKMANGSTTYKIEPLCTNFKERKNGVIYYVNSETIIKLKDGMFYEAGQ